MSWIDKVVLQKADILDIRTCLTSTNIALIESLNLSLLINEDDSTVLVMLST